MDVLKRKNLSKKAMAVTAVAMMLTMAVLVIPSEDSPIDQDDSDAFPPLLAAIGVYMLIGALVAYVTYDAMEEYTAPSSDNKEILRQAAAENVVNQLNTALNHDLAYAQDEPILIGFSTSYFERMGEIAAAELWTSGGTVNYDEILDDSTAYAMWSAFLLNRSNIISTLFEPFKDKSTEWSSSSTYNPMNVSFRYGDTTIVSDGETLVKYALGTTASASANKVYLYNGDELKDGFLYSSTASTITNGTTTYHMEAGYNDIGGIPSGIYTLTAGVTYVGSMMQTYNTGHANVYPSALLIAGDNTTYALDNGTNISIVNGSSTSVASSLNYVVTADGVTYSVDLTKGLDFMEVLNDASKLVFSNTINSASAAWSVFNAAGEASVFVSPSLLIPNLENMDFSSDQVYLIYMSALQQMSDYYQTASGNFNADDVLISEDSLDLICKGTIYTTSSKTTAVVSNVYFTPMCYLRDQAVTVGDTAFLQPGLAMIWDKQTDGTYKASGLVTLENGNHLTITSIEYRGQTYSSLGDGVTLKVTSLPRVSGYDASGTVDPELKFGSMNILQLGIMIIGILGIIAGLLFRRADFVIIGIVAVGVGWFMGSWIWGLIT